MPRKFDQDAKDRVGRLVEDRILAENMSMHPACQAVAPKLGVFIAHGKTMDLSLLAVRETSQNLCLKILLQR
ncbi:hypothetical protein [Corynebacterium pseudodiphtheriticum]|uniref:hypothetical protein n=1 Tax=Corynebacterium pseudodiphtheriticum TaxID=37637 RepID=UPI0020C06333|nr:hypothetical protein [Corynebacterium pseudodiphtheriticum]MDK8685938.1 hypothetical protein [Corynebacterium pseudodiphtheriticum]UQV56102.1 hypothetical protein L9H27_10235 [Corynebacterium pseudodiphtheriticum]